MSKNVADFMIGQLIELILHNYIVSKGTAHDPIRANVQNRAGCTRYISIAYRRMPCASIMVQPTLSRTAPLQNWLRERYVLRPSDDPKMDEDLLHIDLETLPFGEQEEDILRGMMGLPVIVDLDWYPERDENEEDNELDFKTLQLQLIAVESMSAIESLDYEEPYEQLQWNEEMVEQKCCLVPTEMHMVQGPTGEYPRFWGYFCQLYPEYESVEARKATISLPSTLFKLISMRGERFQDFVANPLEDSTVFMIMTSYFGLEEYEVDGEKRQAHKFWDTHLVEGHRSE